MSDDWQGFFTCKQYIHFYLKDLSASAPLDVHFIGPMLNIPIQVCSGYPGPRRDCGYVEVTPEVPEVNPLSH